MDLDAPPNAQILHADFAQGEIKMAAWHRRMLRQFLAGRLAAQAVVTRAACSASESNSRQSVGNAAGLEQLRRARMPAVRGIQGGGELGFRILATKQRSP